MKTLKFKHNLAQEILAGTKSSTWRLFDDKDLTVGDELELVDSNTKEIFTHAKITNVRVKKLGDIEEADFDGHETYTSKEEMLKVYQGYYGDQVNWETEVKMIVFMRC